jgi:hypothetical protein
MLVLPGVTMHKRNVLGGSGRAREVGRTSSSSRTRRIEREGYQGRNPRLVF